MDVSTAAVGPALPLGIAAAGGVLAVALAVSLVVSGRRPLPTAEPPAPGSYPVDDLPSFREHPPGSPGAPRVPAGPVRAPALPPAGRPDPVRALTAMALGALLLIAAAAVVAALAGREATDARPAPGAAPSVPVDADGVVARLAFGGVVLEPRAAGITATYPVLSVTADRNGTALAHLRLPTWNCMADEPPADPSAAGCRAAVPEYADLPSPALRVSRDGDGWRLRGRFPTYTRPNGTGPVFTGRVYELEVVLSAGRERADGWSEARAELFLGGGRTASLDGDGEELSVLRAGG